MPGNASTDRHERYVRESRDVIKSWFEWRRWLCNWSRHFGPSGYASREEWSAALRPEISKFQNVTRAVATLCVANDVDPKPLIRVARSIHFNNVDGVGGVKSDELNQCAELVELLGLKLQNGPATAEVQAAKTASTDAAGTITLEANEVAILFALKNAHSRLLMQVDLESSTKLTRKTLSTLLNRLEAAKYVHRPHGQRKGYTLTSNGVKAAEQVVH